MSKSLTDNEFKRFAQRVQKAALIVGALNIELYGNPQDGIGAALAFDSIDGDRCGILFEPKIARKADFYRILFIMKQAIDGTRLDYEKDRALSEINPPKVDFPQLKSYCLRWGERPIITDGFQPTADRIPRQKWEILFTSLRIQMGQKLRQYIDAQQPIDYQELIHLPVLISNAYLEQIKFAALAQVSHFRVRQRQELVLYLSLTFATREEAATGIEQMKAEGGSLRIIPDSAST